MALLQGREVVTIPTSRTWDRAVERALIADLERGQAEIQFLKRQIDPETGYSLKQLKDELLLCREALRPK